MKKITVLFTVFFISFYSNAQFSLGVVTDFGTNLVDIEKAVGSPLYENREFSTSTYLNDWDKMYFRISLQGMIQLKERLAVGGELSLHRLYFWEEAYYTSTSSSPQFRWGTVWTMGIGVIMKYNLTRLFFIQPGLSLQNYLDGSGIGGGFTIAFGVDIPISESFKLPVELRTDLIPGDALNIGVGLGLGLRKSF